MYRSMDLLAGHGSAPSPDVQARLRARAVALACSKGLDERGLDRGGVKHTHTPDRPFFPARRTWACQTRGGQPEKVPKAER